MAYCVCDGVTITSSIEDRQLICPDGCSLVTEPGDNSIFNINASTGIGEQGNSFIGAPFGLGVNDFLADLFKALSKLFGIDLEKMKKTFWIVIFLVAAVLIFFIVSKKK